METSESYTVKRKTGHDKAIPWRPEQYIRLGPYQIIYTSRVTNKEIAIDLVHLPGGRTLYHEEFLRQYPQAIPPAILRGVSEFG